MASLTELIIQFGIKFDDQQLNKLKNVAVAFDNIKDAADWMGKTFVTRGKGIIDFFSGTLDHANDLKQQAAIMGMSTKTLQQWHYAAQKAGISTDSLNSGMQTLFRQNYRSDKQVLALAKHFQGLTAAQKNQEKELRGLSDEFVYFLSQGPEYIRQAMDMANATGAIIEDKDIEEAKRAKEKLDELQQSFEKTGMTIMTKVAPYVEKFFKAIQEFVKEHPEATFNSIAGVLGIMTAGTVASGLTKLAVFLKGVAGAFGMVATSATAAASATTAANAATTAAVASGGMLGKFFGIGKLGILGALGYGGYKMAEGTGEKVAGLLNSIDRVKNYYSQKPIILPPSANPDGPIIPKGPMADMINQSQTIKPTINIYSTESAADIGGKLARDYPDVPFNMNGTGQPSLT